MADDDFSKLTKDALAKRAGHSCSNPECGARTIGPSEADPHKAVNAGVAAHITANSPGGARYDIRLTPEQRRDIKNGIWLCQNCAHVIDTNDGVDHPVELLQEWKRAHEKSVGASIGKAAAVNFSEPLRVAETIIGYDVQHFGPGVGQEIVNSGGGTGGEAIVTAPAGTSVIGTRVIQTGPGIGMRVINSGPGTGFKSTVIVGPKN